MEASSNALQDKHYRIAERHDRSAQVIASVAVKRATHDKVALAPESRDWWRTKFLDGDYVKSFIQG